MIKKLLLTGLVLVILYGILVISRIWFDIFSFEIFIKISITFGIIGFIILVAVGILYAIKEDEEFKKGNNIG